ncbi:MAG: hypothetical protein IJ024_04910 [Lachnospiraceae bacterium]|nr:hypothetical protein [Lachnospiraceae bacterium]
MFNKIAFLCVNPWENFLTPASQSHSKNYYEWVKKILTMKNVKLSCSEYIDIYGVSDGISEEKLFLENCERLQLLYLQSDRKELLGKIFETADLVIMGLPGSRGEFDKIYMSVFPWKDEILFLWGSHTGRDSEYVARLIRECMLRKEQFIEIKEEWKQIFGIKRLPTDCGSLKLYCNYS